MKTYLVTGGTDGMGKQLALRLLNDGEQVIVVGRNPKKGESFLADTEQIGAKQRATFIQADLSLVDENRRLINELTSKFDVLYGVVFCAVNFTQRKEPLITKEGFEAIFALTYLSRFVLSYGLTGMLEKSADPIILSFCAAGVPASINWEDIQFKNHFVSTKAMVNSSKLNESLGVGYGLNNSSGKIKYVLFNPGIMVKTTNIMKNLKFLLRLVAKVFGKSPEKAIEPALRLLKNVPNDKLTAIFQNRTKPLSLSKKSFDESNAKRLYSMTKELLDKSEVRL